MNNHLIKTFWALLLLTLAAWTVPSPASAQAINENWQEQLGAALADFKGCQQTAGDDCAKYTGQALQKVYRINDFYSQEKGRYLTTSEISEFLVKSKAWGLLGHSYEQETLNNAQQRANSSRAVVAVYTNDEGLGHVVLVTPGKLQPSGSWGLSVPTVASFFATQPEKSFVDKGLSFAFGKNLMKDVLIYARNY